MFADPINRILRRLPAWPIYLLALAHVIWLIWLGATGGLGVEPIEALEHVLGLTGLKLMVAALAVTPLRRFAGINLLKFRRAIGLTTFFYVTVHLLVWLVLDIGDLAAIWADIVKRPYITVGMAGFVLLVPLAITSNDWSVRRLGPGWRRLQRLSYAAALLGAAHYVMLSKGLQLQPLAYLGAVLVLLALRLPWKRRRREIPTA